MGLMVNMAIVLETITVSVGLYWYSVLGSVVGMLYGTLQKAILFNGKQLVHNNFVDFFKQGIMNTVNRDV